VDTSINVVLNKRDRLGITVEMTDITKRGSSSALRIEKVNAGGVAGSDDVKAGYQLRAVNGDRELHAEYVSSLLPRPLVVAFERTDLDPLEVSGLQLQLLFLVYIHTWLVSFHALHRNYQNSSPDLATFQTLLEAAPIVIDAVHSNVIFNGLSATSALPTSLPGAVSTEVDVVLHHLRASLRAAGADDSEVDLIFTNFKAAPVGVSKDVNQRILHLRLAVAKRLSLTYARQDHMDINTCVVRRSSFA
jgi:hypothetical protein